VNAWFTSHILSSFCAARAKAVAILPGNPLTITLVLAMDAI
jgi:hypothetical protein